MKGPWSPAGKLPASFAKLPAEENWKDVKANLPGKAIAATAVPKVFVSLQPAELILLTGPPAYRPVQGTGLQWVSNTESDVFRMGTTGAVYYLVAGRWFTAADFTGPWTFATPTLPADFKKIPLEHERSRVLASVPGTDQAIEAVLLAEIPQTARVNKKELKAPDVAFQGDPKFTPIEKTTVERAVNTDKDVFKIGDLYYMCYQGVWFVGKGAAGPWEVADSVPEQIYKIPVSSPAHHVTYVTIEEDNDDDWVVFAAAAGYTGMMVAWGCTMWGSGWYYPPYWGYGGWLSCTTIRTSRLTVTRPGTTPGPGLTDGVPACMDRTAAPGSARAITRAPALTRAGQRLTVRTARAALRRPTTPAPAPTRRHGRVPTSTAAGARPPCSVEMTGRRPTAIRTVRPERRREL